MNQVFNVKRGYFWFGLLSTIFFIAMAVVSALAMWFTALEDRRLYAAVFFGVFWLAWACLSIWVILTFYLASLWIDDNRIIQQGVIKRKEILFDDIRAVDWRLGSLGQIILKSSTCRIRIDFNDYDPAERMVLIKFFRDELVPEIQHGWELFCHKRALPLRERKSRQDKPLEAAEVRLTRKRIDLYFAPLFFVSVVISAYLFQNQGAKRSLTAPLGFLLYWMMFRFMIPKKGLVTKRISRQPDVKQFLYFELALFAAGVVGLVLFKCLNPPAPLANYIAITLTVTWVAVLLYGASKFDRKKHTLDIENSANSIERWNLLDLHEPNSDEEPTEISENGE